MELSLMLRQLWRHRVFVSLGVLVAVAAAIFATFKVDVLHLKVESKRQSFGAATTQFYVDTRRPGLITSQASAQDLISRARVLATIIGSGEVRTEIARILGVAPSAVSVSGPLPDTPGSGDAPVAQQRANQILGEGIYNIFVDTSASAPTITLYVQASTGAQAEEVAAAVPAALRTYLSDLTRETLPAERARIKKQQTEVPETESERARDTRRAQAKLSSVLAGRTTVRMLGSPIGGNVVTQSGKAIGLVVFVVVLLGWCIAIIVISSALVRKRPDDWDDEPPSAPWASQAPAPREESLTGSERRSST